MAHMVRPIVQWSRCHRQCCSRATFYHLFSYPSLLSPINTHRRLYITVIPSSHRSVHFRSCGLKLPDAPAASDFEDTDTDSDSSIKKSRNEKKREARRAVRWAMDLAAFSPPQIKRILRVASLETEVFDAMMLVKRLGRDVREGKRRQFNYIGRLLREVQPDLMDGLIQATKDGDQSKFQAIYGSETGFIDDDAEETEETESDDDVKGSPDCINMATRWFDGLINKDVDITNEVYSVRSVEFDRQELRRRVRKVYSLQEHEVASEENAKEDKALMAAKRSLTRFLRAIVKQLPIE